jgi:hypothetical protein
MSAKAQYLRVNDALNGVFFDGRFAGQPIYLSLSPAMKDEVSASLGVASENVADDICKCVGGWLSDSGDPYYWVISETNAWVRAGMSEAPPFTSVLFSLVHAAALMAAEDDLSANNYYRRLEQVTGIRSANLSLHGKSTDVFWEALKAWLVKNSFKLGRPTARAFNAWLYVSKAISQAVVRAGDREQFHDLFEKEGFSGNEVLSVSEMRRYLEKWMTSAGPTPHLKRVWREASLRDRLSEAAIAELYVWGTGTPTADGISSGKTAKLSLFANLVQSFPKPSLELHLGRVGDAIAREPLTLEGAGGVFFIENDLFGSVATISPKPLAQGEFALTNSFKFAPKSGRDGASFVWQPDLVIPLSQSGQGNIWAEVRTVSVGISHMVLVRDADQRIAFVEDYLSQVCNKLPSKAVASELRGLPSGWVLYQGVRVSRVRDVPRDDLKRLVPVSDEGTLTISGGLLMDPDIYHLRSKPLARYSASGGPTSIEMRALGGSSDNVIASVRSDKPECTLRIIPSELSGAEGAALQAWQGVGGAVTTKEVYFRSANNANPIRRDLLGRLEYRSVLSAGQQVAASDLSIAGLVIRGELPSRLIHGAAPNAQLAVGQEESPQNATLSEPLAKQEAKQTCIQRGAHRHIYPTYRQKPKVGTKMTIFCGDCGYVKTEAYKLSKPPRNVVRAQAVQLPVLKLSSNAARTQVSLNVLLDALSFLGSGFWSKFQSILEFWSEDPTHPRDIARRLFLLGHLDLELKAGSNAIRFWCVPGPSLNFISLQRAFLSGFRSESLVAKIRSAISSSSAKYEVLKVDGAPNVLFIEGLGAQQVEEALRDVRDPLGRPIVVQTDAALSIATACLGLDGLLASTKVVSIGKAKNLQRFDVTAARWEDTGSANKAGAYRWNEGMQQYAHVGRNGVARIGPYQVVKLMAAWDQGVTLHRYDEGRRVFLSTLGCEPPGLYERTLVACSGVLPTISKGIVQYENVPPDVGVAVLAGLKFEKERCDEELKSR